MGANTVLYSSKISGIPCVGWAIVIYSKRNTSWRSELTFLLV